MRLTCHAFTKVNSKELIGIHEKGKRVKLLENNGVQALKKGGG